MVHSKHTMQSKRVSVSLYLGSCFVLSVLHMLEPLSHIQAQPTRIWSIAMQLPVSIGQTLMLWTVEIQWPVLSMCMTLSVTFLRLRYADPACLVSLPNKY